MDSTIDTPGALGLDRRDDVAALDSRRAWDMNNLDILPGESPEGTRIGPRRWSRRFGQQARKINYAAIGGPGLTGSYKWAYIWTDGAGITHYSTDTGGAIALANQKGQVSGWGNTGTVAIYRTVDGGAVFKLVTGALNAAVNPTYDDSTVDGSLGANIAARASEFDPFVNDSFNQTVITDALLPHYDTSDTVRKLSVIARAVGGNPELYRCRISVDEILHQANSGPSSFTDGPVSTAILNDKLWAAGSSGLYWASLSGYGGPNTGFFAATQPAQPSITSITQAAGPITTTVGHQYVIQNEDPNTGIRSIPSAPAALGVYANKTNTINYSGGNGRTHIYRTTDGGSFFQYVATDTNGSPYVDATLDSALSQQTVPFEVGAAPKWRIIVAHKGLLFGFNKTDSGAKQGGLCGWTSSLYPGNWPTDPLISPDYQFDIDPNDGDEFLAAYSWGEVIVAFKRRRIYVISGDPPTGFRWSAVYGSRDKGCSAPRTIQETSAGLLWLSPAGVCVMTSPGAAPMVISGAINELIVEPQRAANRQLTATLSEEPADIQWDYTAGAVAETIQVQLQLDTDPAFGSIDFDYVTTDALERPYFQAANAAFPAAGASVPALNRVRLAVRPPTSAGPTAGTLYHVRYRIDTGGGFGAWTTLSDFTLPADNPYDDALDTASLPWAFSAHYAPRQEYWLAIPTGGRQWAETHFVLNYGAGEEGGAMPWRRVTLPASSACFVDNWVVDSLPAADYLLFAHPDGFLLTYPFSRDGIDVDTRATVVTADRRISATLAGSTLTAAGTTWPTTRYGLKGAIVAARDANGITYTGLITANTGTTLTVTWAGGRNPPAGTLAIVIGGLDAYLDLPWIMLSGPGRIGILRRMGLLTTSPRTQLAAIVRTARAGRRRLTEAAATQHTLPAGRGFEQIRRQIHRGGAYHQIRIGTINDGELWQLQAIILDIEQTEAFACSF